MTGIRVLVSAALVITLGLAGSRESAGAEGASSNYFPGGYGDYAVATAPNPGWIYANYNLLYSADVERTVLQGRVNAGMDTSAWVNMSALIYTLSEPVAGGRFAVGGFLPLGYADLETRLVGQTAAIAVSDSETALGDIALLPASLYWNKDNWHFNLYELIIAPTGQYDVDNNINLGRNYWSYDTVFALTNLYMETGREFSLVTGFMVNG